MSKNKHYIFHITHINNLPGIINRGLLPKNLIKGSFTDIAHQSVQLRRSNRIVTVSPYGCLHDYAPFYFGMRSPMLCAIHKGQVIGYEDGQEPVIYLVSTAEWCKNEQLPFVFYDGHAAMEISAVYNDLKDLANVNFDVVKAKYWFDDPEHPDRKRQKQAEFLVKDRFPWNGILGIATYDEDTRNKVSTIISQLQPSHQPQVIVKREWYY